MVSFELSEEQRMIRDTVAAFATDEVRPAARAADESGAIPAELIAKSWDLGLVRGALPESAGGYGDARSAVTGALIFEELAFGDLAIAMHALAPRLIAYPVLEYGTEEQHTGILKKFATDQFAAGACAIVEPRFDFDPLAMETTAALDGASYVLNGAKCFVPLAAESETILVCAATDGGAGAGASLVPRATPGLGIGERERNMGLKALATYEVKLENCRIDENARLGGAKGVNFTRLLAQHRVALAAMAVGVARAAYEYAKAYARERKAFGVPIATKQAIAFMLAEMAIEVDASRLLVWEAASRLDKGEDALKESYQARNYSAQAALAVADNAVQTLGGHGYIREHPVELFLRNARGFAAFEGLATV